MFHPFHCLYYYHPMCVTDWKNYGLSIEKGEGCHNYCFACQSIILDKYNDLYDYDWNLNSSVTKSVVNKRNKSVVDLTAVDRLPLTVIMEEERGSNHSNFREDQVATLKGTIIYILIINVYFKIS